MIYSFTISCNDLNYSVVDIFKWVSLTVLLGRRVICNKSYVVEYRTWVSSYVKLSSWIFISTVQVDEYVDLLIKSIIC